MDRQPKTITLAHGGGGEESQQLIQQLFYRAFANELLLQAEDAAVLALNGEMAMTTDSFTVTPLQFNGGDIGELAVTGTVNDLAMMGAKPRYLSCAFMIEEGLAWSELETIVESMATMICEAGALLVCGDTKVVPKGCVDKLFITTTGIGEIMQQPYPSVKRLRSGDALIVSGDIGRHGTVILAARENMQLQTELASDCQLLWPAVEKLLSAGIECHALRDATRGGLSAVLNEWAQASQLGIEVREVDVPVSEPVQGLCELYGFDPFDLANEGTFVLSVPSAQAEQALALLQAIPHHEQAACIGRVTDEHVGKVVLTTPWGSQRYLELPKGELLPRIC